MLLDSERCLSLDTEKFNALEKERQDLVNRIDRLLVNGCIIDEEEQVLHSIQSYLVTLYTYGLGSPDYLWHWDYLSPELSIQSHILIGCTEKLLLYGIDLIEAGINNFDWEAVFPLVRLRELKSRLTGLETLHGFNLRILGQNEPLTEFQLLVDRLLASKQLTHQDMKMLSDTRLALKKQKDGDHKRIFGEIFPPVRLGNSDYFQHCWPFPEALFEKSRIRAVIAGLHLRTSIRQVILDTRPLHRIDKDFNIYFTGTVRLLRETLHRGTVEIYRQSRHIL